MNAKSPMGETPFDFDEMKSAFFRGEFARAIQMIEGLRSIVSATDVPIGVFSFGGLAHYYSGDFPGAIQLYGEALMVYPDSIGLLSNYSQLLACCPDPEFQDGAKAVKLAMRSCEVSNWNNHILIGNLAAAHARAGQFDKAEKHYLMARKRCPPDVKDIYERHIFTVRNNQAITIDLKDAFERFRLDYC